MKIQSIVIVQNPFGYTATLRFEDSKLDECVASDSHWGIYERIERTINRKGDLWKR
jgi:hypothetical protein